MSESENVLTSPEQVWDYIAANPKIMGVQISDNQGLDLLNALRDIWIYIEKDADAARDMLTMLVTVIVSSIHGQGNEVIEELLVEDAKQNFDKGIQEILNDPTTND
jgi:hypothetical protein